MRNEERRVVGVMAQDNVVGRVTPASAAAAKFFSKVARSGLTGKDLNNITQNDSSGLVYLRFLATRRTANNKSGINQRYISTKVTKQISNQRPWRKDLSNTLLLHVTGPPTSNAFKLC